MMLYRYLITTPANTLQAAAQETELLLARGVIIAVTISFPPGPSGKLHLQLFHRSHPYLPTNPDESFAWEDARQQFDDFYPIPEAPYSLMARTWNTSTLYPHAVEVQVNILTEEEIMQRYGGWGVLTPESP